MKCLPGYDAWRTRTDDDEAYVLLCERVSDMSDDEIIQEAKDRKWWDEDDEDADGNPVVPNILEFRERLVEKLAWEEL